MLKKGFIGPIGDDLPSLTPLIFGLIMFFSAFTTAFTSFDQRNTEFFDDIALMKISKVMQTNGYIYSHDNFESLCSTIGAVNINYVAAITPDAYNRAETKAITDFSFFSSGGKKFYCTNTEGTGSAIKDIVTIREVGGRKMVSRIYPIVVEDEKIVKPMHLVVVAWK